MKLTIEPTEHFFMAGDGAPVLALISGIAFTARVQSVVEDLGLVSIPPPTPEHAQRWAEKIMGDAGPKE